MTNHTLAARLAVANAIEQTLDTVELPEYAWEAFGVGVGNLVQMLRGGNAPVTEWDLELGRRWLGCYAGLPADRLPGGA
jgi:hypothetical protein